MKRLKRIYPDNEEDIDDAQKMYERQLTGRWTAARMNAVEYMVEKLTWAHHCGCVHDCCGCQYEQRAHAIFVGDTLTLQITKYFNY